MLTVQKLMFIIQKVKLNIIWSAEHVSGGNEKHNNEHDTGRWQVAANDVAKGAAESIKGHL